MHVVKYNHFEIWNFFVATHLKGLVNSILLADYSSDILNPEMGSVGKNQYQSRLIEEEQKSGRWLERENKNFPVEVITYKYNLEIPPHTKKK